MAYFATNTSICRTDGTEGGTRCFPRHTDTGLAGLHGKVYAISGTPDGGQALYEFDGVQEPRAILALQPGERASQLASDGKQLYYFSTRSMPDGVRLNRTDGTAEGTARTRLFATDRARMIDRAGNAFLFHLRDTSTWKRDLEVPNDLWASDGTPAGTTLLMPDFYPFVRAHTGSALVFVSGQQLWRTDGTAAGTFLLATNVNVTAISAHESFAYFMSDGNLWRTDGTQATVLRSFPGHPQSAGIAGSRLIAIEQADRTSTVWAADASGGAAEELVKIVVAFPNAAPVAITHAGKLAYFIIRQTGSGDELWRTDGTAAGTYSLLSGHSFNSLSILGDRLVFFVDDFVHGQEPWVTDGTREGTKMIANLAPEGVVRGTVTDATTGAPIANALVQTGGFITRSDADGRYTIEGAIGRMSLLARGETYIAQTRTLDVAAHEEVTVDFALQAGAVIQGRVTDASGNPREGLIVKVSAVDGSQMISAGTSAEGTFTTTPLPTNVPWNVRVEAHNKHNAAEQKGITLTPHETRVVDLVMTPFGRVLVRIVDSVTGGPVRTNRFGRVVAHDANGSFRDSALVYDSMTDLSLPDGDYQFVIDSPVYRNRWMDGDGCASRDCVSIPRPRRGTIVHVASGTVATADFVTRPMGGSVRAIVVDDETGAPLPDMRVSPGFREDDPIGGMCETDALGRCETEPLFPDRALVLVVTPPPGSAYLRRTTPFTMHFDSDPRPQIKVRLTRGATLTGRVTDRTGRALASAAVLIGSQSRTPDANGYYSIRGIPAGTYDVIVQLDGYTPFTTAGVVLTNGEKTTLDVTLQR